MAGKENAMPQVGDLILVSAHGSFPWEGVFRVVRIHGIEIGYTLVQTLKGNVPSSPVIRTTSRYMSNNLIDLTYGPYGSSPPAHNKKVSTGSICKRCNSMNSYAEPNQKDGSYVCYECR